MILSTKIYTPITLWQNFSYDLPITEEVINETEKGGIIYKKIYFSGKKTEKGQVKIFGMCAYEKGATKLPALLILPNIFKSINKEILTYYAKKGYYAFSVDYSGQVEGAEEFTVYPEDLAYANASEAGENLHTATVDLKETCWYEWVSVAKYAITYLKDNPLCDKIGTVGIKRGATLLWQAIGNDADISCFVAEFGLGWRAYRGYYKFGDKTEPEFSDDMYGYLSAIEAQSYAKFINCPALLVTATNNYHYDTDRAYDTYERLKNLKNSYINYAVQCDKYLDQKCLTDIELFLAKHLQGKELDNIEEIEISALIKDGKIVITVELDKTDLTSLEVYSAEETVEPFMRSYNTLAKKVSENKSLVIYEYQPNRYSKRAFFFAQATYKNGFTISSRIIAKEFSESEVENDNKSTVIYSSKDTSSLMQPLTFNLENNPSLADATIFTKKGAMSIDGVTCKTGLLSLKMNAKKDKPKDTSMLMFDAYSKKGDTLTISLIENMFSESSIEYTVTMQITAGETWHNAILPLSKFKTADGMICRSYENVNAVSFKSESGTCLLNNIMWI